MPKVIPPSFDPDDEFFWEGVRNGRFLLNRCANCRTLVHPPVPMCGECHSLTWDTQEASGRGKVYTWLVSRPPGDSGGEARIAALIELEEGVRIVSNLVDIEPDAVFNEMPVEVTFVDYGTCVLPQFRPVLAGPGPTAPISTVG